MLVFMQKWVYHIFYNNKKEVKMKVAVVTKKNAQNDEVFQNIISKIKEDESITLVNISKLSEIDNTFDKILVFGGDGTMLNACKKASEFSLAILGVNLGNLGFLTQFECNVAASDVIDALHSICYQDKMLLEVGIQDYLSVALNEAVVKSASSHPIFLDLYIDGCFVDSYHADGMIVSSPTGSTAYSLSAGGAVLAPNLDGIIINPICPHSLHSRALVVGANSKIELKFCNSNQTAKAICALDGQEEIYLERGDTLTISKSATSVKFVDVSGEDFYARLLKKMNRWGTTN